MIALTTDFGKEGWLWDELLKQVADLETKRILRWLNSKLKFPGSNELMESSFIQKISEVPLQCQVSC